MSDQPMLAKSAATASAGSIASPDALADQILSLMRSERMRAARELASKAARLHPKHARLQRVCSVFDNRGKAKISAMGPQPSMHDEFEWLKNAPAWARGKLVALVGAEAVAVADTFDELREILAGQDLPKKPLLVQIDEL